MNWRDWWNAREPRERRVLAIGGAAAAVLLVWALVWHPLSRARADLRLRVAAQQADLAEMRVQAVRAQQLRGQGARAKVERQGKSLLALADATARSGGLGDALKRVEPAGAKTVKVAFESARFDALVGWIEALAAGYGVEAVELSVDRADGVGFVNARVTLQDAP